MTVDRSYLPYRSARHYQDRKMAKWMGFFLSEHVTALSSETQLIDFNSALEDGEKHLLLNQLYAQHLSAIFTIITDNKMTQITGIIDSINYDKIGIQASDAHYFITLDQLLTISLEEELDNEY